MGKEHGHVNWMDQIFKEYEREVEIYMTTS